jgi:hypothetical protein
MSKIPPQLRQSLPALLQTAAAFTFRHFVTSPRALEDFLTCAQHFVQRFLKVRRALGELLSHLRNILLKALLDLFSEQLLQRSVAKPLGVFGWVIGDNVRDESPREPLGALIGILREKWIERTASAAVGANSRAG